MASDSHELRHEAEVRACLQLRPLRRRCLMTSRTDYGRARAGSWSARQPRSTRWSS